LYLIRIIQPSFPTRRSSDLIHWRTLQTGPSDVAHRRPLYDGPERGGVRDPPAGRKARHSDALRDVRILDGDRGRVATRSQKDHRDRKSTRLNSSHLVISYAV